MSGRRARGCGGIVGGLGIFGGSVDGGGMESHDALDGNGVSPSRYHTIHRWRVHVNILSNARER